MINKLLLSSVLKKYTLKIKVEIMKNNFSKVHVGVKIELLLKKFTALQHLCTNTTIFTNCCFWRTLIICLFQQLFFWVVDTVNAVFLIKESTKSPGSVGYVGGVVRLGCVCL